MLTYLRIGSDTLEETWFLYRTMRAAIDSFAACALELDRYGQRVEASLHFVGSREEEPAEYPDRVLALGPRGGIQVHRT
jgi:hypothetical protein